MTSDPEQTGGVFISYRRKDASHAAGRIRDHLEAHLRGTRVFMDVTGIPPGRDFTAVLEQDLAQCSVMLVVIGQHWLDRTDDGCRLADPQDVVRRELEVGLERLESGVVPTLVDGAKLPGEEDVPASVRGLVRRQAHRVDHESFAADVEALVAWLKPVIDPRSATTELASGWTATPVANDEHGSLGLDVVLDQSTHELRLQVKPLTIYVMLDGLEVGRLKLTRDGPAGEFDFDVCDGHVVRRAKLTLLLPSPGWFGLPRTSNYLAELDVDAVVLYEGPLLK